MRAILVDDEQLTAEYIARLLSEAGVEVLDYFTNPIEVVERVEQLRPDVLFLDIEMPEMSGLELAERIYKSTYDCEVVFITAYNQYAIDAFRVNAIDYLLKPVLPEDLKQTVERVKSRLGAETRDHMDRKTRRIRVSLFGNQSVNVDKHPMPIRWVTAKCAELFVYMLLQKKNDEVSKWKLIEALWQEKNLEKADINLRSTISRLNKTLREYNTGITIVNTGNGYQMEISDVVLDVDAFQLERIVLESIKIRPDNLVQMERVLYQCDQMFLEEISGEWCEEYRESYRRYFIHLANKMLAYYECVGTDPFKKLILVELMIKNDPYEDPYRILALKLHFQISGKRQAMEYYHNYEALLDLELGSEPSGEIKDLYQSLKDM